MFDTELVRINLFTLITIGLTILIGICSLFAYHYFKYEEKPREIIYNPSSKKTKKKNINKRPQKPRVNEKDNGKLDICLRKICSSYCILISHLSNKKYSLTKFKTSTYGMKCFGECLRLSFDSI